MIEMDPVLIKRLASRGKRIDGRTFDAYRDINIENGIISSAEGSSRVKVGDTEVLAGAKMNVGTPFSDTPNEGVLMVGVELLPLASPEFESGPPREDAIEIARVVDRAIRESKAIDFTKLCIKEGEKVWIINVDIDVLNDDGNLIDACSIAAISALLDTKIPELDNEGNVRYGTKTDQKLPIKYIPLSVTITKIDDIIIVDPNLNEETALDARLTVGTIKTDNGIKLCSMQKGEACGITQEDLEKMIDFAIEKSEEIRSKVEASRG